MKIAVAPHARSLGFDGSGREVPAAYEVMDVREAVERVYRTDAHYVCYVVEGAARQPRINKPGLPYFKGRVLATTFVCDVDNPGHVEWNDALSARAAYEWDSTPELRSCGIYHTLHGRHIIQPLATPIPVGEAEPHIRRWLLSLESAGLDVDWACRDWTRHLRLANVVRPQTGPFRSPFIDLSRMRPIDLEPIVELPCEREEHAPRALRTRTELAWVTELPAQWKERAVAIAKAVREGVTDGWHEMYLALGGSLLGRGLPPERLPAMVEWIATAAGSEKPASHARGARDTARRYADRLDITGYPTLRRRWRAVAAALDEAAPTRAEVRLRAQIAADAAAAPPIHESLAAMTAAIRNAPDGLTVISAECGLGKTNAAMSVAAERASKSYASATAEGLRAPAQSKTSISVDKNALAVQVASDLRARGAAVRRIFGPLSVVRDDGTPECRFANVAALLVEGGQPMQWVLCKDCEHRDVCKAKDGIEGPEDARITVGPHALLKQLDAAAGSTGLLVIDEPPPALETVVLTRHDFADARDRTGSFDAQYALAMRPIVEGFDRWMDVALSDAATEPLLALREGLPAGADIPALVEGAKGAIPEERRSRAPPIQRADIYVAKGSENYARTLGSASRVLGALHRAVTTSDRVSLRVEKRADTVALIVTMPRVDLAQALKRQGSVVVTDANAEIHLPVFEKIVGYAPRFHRFAAADGAPIARTLLRCRKATRKGWLVGGRLALDGVVPALREAIEWGREDPSCRRLGIITMRLLRLYLEAAWRLDDAPDELMATEIGHAREKLGPVLRGWDGEILFGHYGAVRGLNTMADVDALVTLGDPWPNVGDARNDAAFLGLAPTWQQRLEAMCRAELEQAHGRLRAVHRARPGRALHVGTVLPSGYGWSAGHVQLRTMKPGPSRLPSAMDVEELRGCVQTLGGMRGAAGALGCSPATIIRYCAGERPVPPELAAKLRSICQRRSISAEVA